VGTETINLEGVRLVETTVDKDIEGITFIFDAQTLAPGERIVVVKNREAFQSRFGSGVRIAAGDDGLGGPDGEFGGGLGNGGEQLTLEDGNGAVIQQFSYNDSGRWPGRADGGGSSIEVLDPQGDYNDGDNWRSSSEFGGTPGSAGLGPDNRLVFNEILAHTDPPDVDMIELMNTTSSAIDINGWYLSDSNANYLKYRIVENDTRVPPGGYYVLTETQFADALGGLSSYQGEELWLIESHSSGRPVRFVDRVDFKEGTENGVSVGRWPNGEGGLFAMDQRTFGTENTGPKPGEVIISEVHYHPVDPDGIDGPLDADLFEFVEIYNRSVSAVDLSTWQVDGGIEFPFAQGTLINPGQTLVVVSFAPEDASSAELFRAQYGLSSTVRLVGPFSGQLANNGEPVRLEWADEPPAVQPDFIPWILEDRIDYDDEAPWPETADGLGDALGRIEADNFGRFAESWTPRTPSPGVASFFVRQAGDANEDGSFNQLDLLAILTVQKYNTGQPATWKEGDWNGDGVFDRKDIVAALMTNNYLKGPYAGQAAHRADSVFEEIGRRTP
jgi:hypothetical protein